MPAELTAHKLSVVFEVPGETPLSALGPISFDITSGEFACLLGPSGCGKTTLIRVFAGLQSATQGRACLSGKTISGPSPRVGLMFQSANLLPWRTVIDNVALPLELAGVPKSDRYQIALDLMLVLGLAGFETTYPDELSGGMAQRVALGRILVQSPDVLLLDEPLGALDAMTREKVGLDLLRLWSQNRQTVIMVTHDINESVLLSDRVLVMSHRPGRIVADIPVELSRPRRLAQIYESDFVEIARLVRAAIDRA